ncbi:MAG TPA: tetratricopeptide repeat protein [Chromatiales bacterium]|nr:tetratricopeptide repeat protein [Chromatiales bacterium]
MTENKYILEGTEQNFSALVLENSRKGLVVVDFWAPWAGPSLRQQAVLSRLATEYAGRFLLVTVNTDKQKGLASEYGVRSLPSFKLFRHGRMVEVFHGMQPEADYSVIIDRWLKVQGPAAKQEALALWNAGEPDRALQRLAEGALEDPGDVELPLTMARMLLKLDRLGEALALLRALPEPLCNHPEVVRMAGHLGLLIAAKTASDDDNLEVGDPSPERQYRLAARAVIDDDYATALEYLFGVLERSPDFAEGAARQGVLALFDLLGSHHALVKRYRPRLATLTR